VTVYRGPLAAGSKNEISQWPLENGFFSAAKTQCVSFTSVKIGACTIQSAHLILRFREQEVPDPRQKCVGSIIK
jgi:hypothetical protein